MTEVPKPLVRMDSMKVSASIKSGVGVEEVRAVIRGVRIASASQLPRPEDRRVDSSRMEVPKRRRPRAWVKG